MTDYSVVHGIKVQNFSSDPDNPLSGQVWYNSTTAVLKTFYVNPGSWATGGAMNTARATLGGVGTQTAALAFGGRTCPPSADADITEAYNGSAWTEVNDLNTTRRLPEGAGTSTAALGFGGRGIPPDYPPDVLYARTETWNGTNWTEVNDLNTARYYLAGCGASNTASLAFGGSEAPRTAKTETWNGTNWTEVNDLTRAINQHGGTGTSTAALAIGGDVNPDDKTLLWNGTNWTEVNDLNTGRKNVSAAGITTAAVASGGGSPSIVALAETWNGTNWTEVGDLNAAISKAGGAGTTAAALSFGGNNPPDVTTAATEEFVSGDVTATLGSE